MAIRRGVFCHVLLVLALALGLCGQSHARRVARPSHLSIGDASPDGRQVAAPELATESVGTARFLDETDPILGVSLTQDRKLIEEALNPYFDKTPTEAVQSKSTPSADLQRKPQRKRVMPKPKALVLENESSEKNLQKETRASEGSAMDSRTMDLNSAGNSADSAVEVGDSDPPIIELPGDIANYTYSFEVLRPVVAPSGAKMCVVPLMTNHLFANAPPPFEGTYVPPTDCGESWSLVVLTWSANVIGRQYDRIAAVFFDGLEVLRTTTEEPSATGVKWSFDTDITRFAAFLKKERLVSITLGNVVDQTYTGIYNVTVSLTVYAGPTPPQYADIIIPITAADSGFAAFSLSNGTNLGTKVVSDLPRNVYRAQLEVVQSQTANDEFYWGNVPDEYIEQLPEEYQSDFLSGGVYRETQAYLDGILMGAIWQYPVIYTGGGNPYWWRPVVGIGAFVVPTTTLEITPFVFKLADGKNHTLGLAVDGVLTGGMWYVSGALHLWLDQGGEQTSGKLVAYEMAPFVTPSVTVDFFPTSTFDANITTVAHRSTLISGVVETSFGTFTSIVTSRQTQFNLNQILEDGFVGITTQLITAAADVKMEAANGSSLYAHSENFDFPLYVLLQVFESSDEVNFVEFGKYSHGFSFNKTSQYLDGEVLTETQTNIQSGGGVYSSSVPGRGYSAQNFSYVSNFQGCYSQTYSQADLVFAYNNISTSCDF